MENRIFGLHPHVWYVNSGDVFKNNIVCKSYQPAIMGRAIASDGKWGKELDYNFYVANEDVMTQFAGNGCDKNSMNGDPLFVDPINGDFRVREESPALKLGFVNFPMDQFGVVKPSLRAIAKTPEIPLISIHIETKKESETSQAFNWMEMLIKEPSGDEMSAFGVGYNDGGVALTSVPENSLAEKLGFRSGDLIQQINGFRIKNIWDLKEFLNRQKISLDQNVFEIIRNQGKSKITINQSLPAVMQKKH